MPRPMSRLAPTVAIALALALPVGAQHAAPPDAARSVVEALAMQLDRDGDRSITRAELGAGLRVAFASLDADRSGDVDRGEFVGWEHGLADMAAFRGRAQAHDGAFGLVFDLYDADGSGAVDPAEYAAAMDASLDHADRDGDAALTYDEFYSRFPVNVALRNAMADGS